MKLTWMGHGSFRIDMAGQAVLIDPWITGNPMLADKDGDSVLDGVDQILVTHGHFDHTTDVSEISQRCRAPVSGMYELAQALFARGAVEGAAFNKGGTVHFGDLSVSMVPASHSSSMAIDGQHRYMGAETGFVLRGGGQSLYFSGDTAPMADMDWIGDYYKPEVGVLSAGGHYTMDMDLAAYAAQKYFNFGTVIPCHYRTFPLLEQSAEAMVAGLPGVQVIEPQVLEPIVL